MPTPEEKPMDLVRNLLYVLPSRVGNAAAWFPPLLARVAVGWTFALTGWGKLGDIGSVVEFFRELGIPYPELQAPFVASVELVCGAMLVVGLLSRLAALPLIGTMVVAIATAQWQNVSSFGDLFGLSEFLYIVIFAWIAAAGPGPVALDTIVTRVIERRGDRTRESALAPSGGSDRRLGRAAVPSARSLA
jgi:putative oxidoreductase